MKDDDISKDNKSKLNESEKINDNKNNDIIF